MLLCLLGQTLAETGKILTLFSKWERFSLYDPAPVSPNNIQRHDSDSGKFIVVFEGRGGKKPRNQLCGTEGKFFLSFLLILLSPCINQYPEILSCSSFTRNQSIPNYGGEHKKSPLVLCTAYHSQLAWKTFRFKLLPFTLKWPMLSSGGLGRRRNITPFLSL